MRVRVRVRVRVEAAPTAHAEGCEGRVVLVPQRHLVRVRARARIGFVFGFGFGKAARVASPFPRPCGSESLRGCAASVQGEAQACE